MPISTVHQPAQVGSDTATRARPPAIGMLSTYPPTQCGLATFSAALIQHLHLSAGRSAWCGWSTSPSRGPARTWWRSW